MNQKRSAGMRMSRNGRWLLKQPRGSAGVPQAELFVSRVETEECKNKEDYENVLC